jgi:hypothetical protein
MTSSTILFDSKEEEYFSWYLDELSSAGYVDNWQRPQTIVLANNLKAWSRKNQKSKPKSTVLLREQTYTPDFEVVWTPKAKEKGLVVELSTCDPLTSSEDSLPESYSAPFVANNVFGRIVSTIEIKGGFTEHDESRIYSILSKWTYQLYGVYIQRVIVSTAPNSIFAKTFCPAKFILTDKTLKLRKLKFTPRLISEL